MAFQSFVNNYPAPGRVGQLASLNPTSSVVSGLMVAGTSGVLVGRFAWNTLTASTGVLTANNTSSKPVVPDGFISDMQKGLITAFLSNASLTVPAGLGVVEHDRGDFWAFNNLSDAAIGNKVYANIVDGQITTAATGQFLVENTGSATVFTASMTAGSYNLVVATITSGVLAVGQFITLPGLPFGAYIESQTNGSAGSTGTYVINVAPAAAITAQSGTATSVEPYGGASYSSVSGSTAGTTLTLTTNTYGTVLAGMLVNATNVPTGTYVVSVAAGGGSLVLSATPTGSVSAADFSPWVETPWVVKRPGNIGDAIIIGIKN